jgi:hypothetical protein
MTTKISAMTAHTMIFSTKQLLCSIIFFTYENVGGGTESLSFNEARQRAENPIGVQTDAADTNLDLVAQTGRGMPKKKPLSMADV